MIPIRRFPLQRKAVAEPSKLPLLWTTATTAVLTALQAIVVTYFGFAIKDRVDLALRERQQQVGAVDKMASLVDLIIPGAATSEQDTKGKNPIVLGDDGKKRIVVRLTMFGNDAIEPLLVMMAGDVAMNPDVPAHGLRLLAIAHKPDVCDGIERAQKVLPSDSAKRVTLERLKNELDCKGSKSHHFWQEWALFKFLFN